MTPCFGDTFFFLALLVEGDEAHERAIESIRNLTRDVYTTTWVLTELGDAISSPATRKSFVPFLEFLRFHPKVVILPTTASSSTAASNVTTIARTKIGP